ncbi:MAG: type II secretion system protein J [Planctomycetota bacterium]
MSARRSTSRRAGAAGFTLIELLVVLGILVAFMGMLIQFVDSGVRLFDEGEAGQMLTDRAEAARVAVERELRVISADCRSLEPVVPDDRLLVQRLPPGLPPKVQKTDARAFVLRAGVALAPSVEERMQEDQLLLQAALDLGADASPQSLRERAAMLQATSGLRGRGRLLLAQWPQSDDGALLELRVGRFLLDQQLPVGPDRSVDPFEVPWPGSPELPSLLLHAHTERLVGDLLFADVELWSQTTTDWDAEGPAGPEVVWDSARAGWLADPTQGPVFRQDLGPDSLREPADDVHPRALRVTLVVAEDESRPREGLLAGALAPDGRALQLVNGERFPGAPDGGWAKIGSEWVRYQERAGDVLRGLSRGVRGTRAQAHSSGAVVRIGRTVRFVVPLPHGKDDWNGGGDGAR